ncbi:phage terminase small subunit [Hyphomicrobium sp. 1Nfss2.1]|uniref:terminase small subunit n=1 Tax=Hyphomicrobium sp. 1Nfss2.1 TaxID=3413936 RepID=UPI003C7AE626
MRTKPDPTHPLRNTRHEAFVQALLRGETQDAAYASAGYTPSRHSAARLATNDNIRARLAYLRSKVASIVVEKTGVTIADVVAELAKLGFSNMRDYVSISHGGQVQVDVAQAPDRKWAAIQEFTSETYTEGKGEDARIVTRTRIKLHSKESALVSIGKHLGMFDKEKDPGAADAALQPKAPSHERLEEMRRRYAPKSKPEIH